MDIVEYMVKQKKKIVLLLSLIIFLAGVWKLFQIPMKNEAEIAKVLGISSAQICSTDYSLERFTIKDGDIIEIYDLSESTISCFQSQSTFILYDEYYELRPTFQKVNWTKSPIDSIAYNEIIDFALMGRTNPLRDKWVNEIRKILSTSKAYYSFYYKDIDVALYVLDIQTDKLYVIYLYF